MVDYHKQFYRPDNLCITIFGNVTIDDVMKSIRKIEKKILSKSNPSKFTRPWLAPLPTLETTHTKTLIPSANDDLPQMYIAWRGPNCVTEYRMLLACTTLLSYLRRYAIPHEFTNETFYGSQENAEAALTLRFENVATDKIDSIYPKLQTKFQEIADGKVKQNKLQKQFN